MSAKNMETSYIDISQSKNVADMVFSLGKSLETGLFSEKKIVLDLGNIDLERPQILGLKSLVLGAGSELALIHSSSPTTKLVALEMDIQVVDVKELEEKQEMKAEAVKDILANSNDVLGIAPKIDIPAPVFVSEEKVSELIAKHENFYSDISAMQEPQDEHDELLDNLMSDIKDVTQELGERMEDEALSKIQADDIAPIEPLLTPVFEEVFTPETPVSSEEKSSETFTSVQEEFVEMPKPLDSEQAGEIFAQKEEQKSYISDVVEPREELLEKEFIIDEKAKANIIGDTAYIKQTLRSGQVVSFDGNVVIIGNCHSGSEIVAAGDITVWGVLEGIAHAGSRGDENAVIRALKIDAIQLRIASQFARRPDRANVDFAEKTDTFTPEEARVRDGRIYIYTLNTENQI